MLAIDYRESHIANFSRSLIRRCGGSGRVDLVVMPLHEAPSLPETGDYNLIFIDRFLALPDEGWLVKKLMDLPNPPPICLTGNYMEREELARFPIHRATFALINLFEIIDLFHILAARRPGWRSA